MKRWKQNQRYIPDTKSNTHNKIKIEIRFNTSNEANESAISGSAEILLTISKHAFLLQKDKDNTETIFEAFSAVVHSFMTIMLKSTYEVIYVSLVIQGNNSNMAFRHKRTSNNKLHYNFFVICLHFSKKQIETMYVHSMPFRPIQLFHRKKALPKYSPYP